MTLRCIGKIKWKRTLPHIFHIDISYIQEWVEATVFRLLIKRIYMIQDLKKATPTVVQIDFIKVLPILTTTSYHHIAYQYLFLP